jgi:hypothetical protein
VRCLDAAGAFLVSGGNDDQLHIYDVKVGQKEGRSLFFESVLAAARDVLRGARSAPPGTHMLRL